MRAVDYLLKPIAPKRLALALQRACGTDGPVESTEDLETSYTDQPTRPLGLQDKVLLGSPNRIAYLAVGNIVAAEAGLILGSLA